MLGKLRGINSVSSSYSLVGLTMFWKLVSSSDLTLSKLTSSSPARIDVSLKIDLLFLRFLILTIYFTCITGGNSFCLFDFSIISNLVFSSEFRV